MVMAVDLLHCYSLSFYLTVEQLTTVVDSSGNKRSLRPPRTCRELSTSMLLNMHTVSAHSSSNNCNNGLAKRKKVRLRTLLLTVTHSSVFSSACSRDGENGSASKNSDKRDEIIKRLINFSRKQLLQPKQ